jgi:lysophospholipase L1-like esterase
VSVHLPAAPPTLTAHLAALQTSYVAAGGDLTLTPGGGRFDRTLSSWPILVGLDVRTPQAENAVLAVGDSITDGIGSPPDAAERLTDGLAGRLAAAGGPRAMAVLNAGISGNQLLAGDRTIGPAAATRLDRELAATVGVTDVVLHIGTNDIAAGRSATEIIDGLSHYADRAKAAGRRVFLTTITPTTSGAHGTPAAMRVRAAVNSWIRAHGAQRATGVFDFAAAVADPQAPTRLATAFDSGDGLHLSAAGYRALAAAVDLDRLTGSPCRSDPSAGSRTVIAER